ncbi:MAG: carboxypeptidase-like regulatory domain-containing protein [Acidobacteriota bacterium]
MKSNTLNQLRVASPCHASWDQMSGDNRVRFCNLCQLHVYNFAELTRIEAESLIANTEGRICGRLYRRSDGTAITKDCPVGLRALRRRVARRSAAVFAALMSFLGVVVGQRPAGQSSGTKPVTISRKAAESSTASGAFSGTILDSTRAVIVSAKVTVTNQETKKSYQADSNAEGRFLIEGIAAGNYDIIVKSPGFLDLEVKHVALGGNEAVNLEAVLEVAETMGVIVQEIPLIDTSSPSNTIILKQETIRRLPIKN